MTSNNTQEYSLSQLFSSPNRKIIIPDFQRDYCWGDKTHGEKNDVDIVSSFFDTLIDEFSSSKENDVLLGKIDVYEDPKDYIYLTDGQQRLTTLYLIIGMLYRKTKNDNLKRCLISDCEEKQDDKEPYLQYAIRDSTVFFLRDLVHEFFLKSLSIEKYENEYKEKKKEKEEIDEFIPFCIKKQYWYSNEYDLDPTIISMLSALEIIENRLNETNIAITEFSDFFINKIKIQYYDVQDKKHGEERFVIINTTGKSLTESENVKPILLGNVQEKKYSEEWEDRETWFWQNRDQGKEQTADEGVDEFLKWCFQIAEKQDSIDLIKESKELYKKGKENIAKRLKLLDEYFTSLKGLIKLLGYDDKIKQQFKFLNPGKEVRGILGLRNLSPGIKQNILLPLLAFMVEINSDQSEVYQFLRRLRKNYFDKTWPERNHNYVDWRHVLQIIEKGKTVENILCYSFSENDDFKKIHNTNNNVKNWYNVEERIKDKLRIEPKNKIAEWEDRPDFMGDLSPLLRMILIFNGKNEVDNEKHLDKIEINEDDYNAVKEIEPAYNTWDKLFNSENIELRNRFNLLFFRYSRNYAWNNVYSFGRKKMDYFRQGYDSKRLIYQNWFYKVISTIYGKGKDGDIIKYLKDCNRNILMHYKVIADGGDAIQYFKEASIEDTGQPFCIKLFSENFKRPDIKANGSQRRHYVHWLGYVWYYYEMLRLTSENKLIENITEEIIYDTYNQDENSIAYDILGNQFLRPWSKTTNYIRTFENIQNNSWRVDQEWIERNNTEIFEILSKEFN